ncbi:MAG TPA: DinB family protein [Cytophagaceae bacterium]|nr:DinB family protein [Cytophagaceae bacterium]
MTTPTLFVKMALDGWQVQIKAFNTLLDSLTDEQLMKEIAPGKNRGIYLLGHLTAVHDHMMSLLRFEDSLYPELSSMFIQTPDKTVKDLPSIAQLKLQWKTIDEKLSKHLQSLPPEEWFTRHGSVSEEDFAKEPHRNRLNVLMSRTAHLSYHRGQMVLLK